MTEWVKYLWGKLDGLKTFLASGVFILLGVADYFDAVNVRPVLDQALGEDKSAKIMVFLPIVFATLRFVTKNPPRWMRRHRDADDEGDCTKQRDQ